MSAILECACLCADMEAGGIVAVVAALVIPPALIIAGIVLTVQTVGERNYAHRVANFEDEIRTYNALLAPIWSRTIGNVSSAIGSSAPLVNVRPTSGTQEFLAPDFVAPSPATDKALTLGPTSFVLQSNRRISMPIGAGAADAVINAVITLEHDGNVSGGNVSTISVPAPPLKVVSEFLTCTSSQAVARTSCLRACELLAPSSTCSVRYTGKADATCGQFITCTERCEWTEVASAVCRPLNFTATTGRFAVSPIFHSCVFPFRADSQPTRCVTKDEQLAGRADASVWFVSDQDPLILAQVLGGSSSGSLGMTDTTKRGVGLALLITGIALGVAVASVFGFIKCRRNERRNNANFYTNGSVNSQF
jgi:hypothetical protein